MKILFTGFDPFGGETINPAYEAVKLLPKKIADAEVITIEIPTIFRKGAEKMLEAIDKHKPDIVICVGQAGGRAMITPEFVAINYVDARIKDNEGNQPVNEKIKDDGENAYFTSLPIKAIVSKLKENGIPAAISYTAGTYVCNDIMYNLLYHIAKYNLNIKGGFVHVPFALEQATNMPVTTPSMSIEIIRDALATMAEVALTTNEDVAIAFGETH